MNRIILIFLLIFNISAFAQNGKDISNLVGGSSIFESNKIYGKVKTIENVCVIDTNFVNELMNTQKRNLHFQNYFFAFDTLGNIVEKQVFDSDTLVYHNRFSYNKNTVFEIDLLKNTEIKYIYSNEKRTELLAKEWLDSTNTQRRQNYSYSYKNNNKKRLTSYIRTIYENDSIVSKRNYDQKFCFDNLHKIKYTFCYYLPEKKYTKGKKYDTFYYTDKNGVVYQEFIYFNKYRRATKFVEMLQNKKHTEIFYEYDYNLLQKVTKHHYHLNAKSIYTYNSRQYLLKKEVFNDIKAKNPVKTYNFHYETDIHSNWVKMFDSNTNKVLVERKIMYY